ncbi:MAG: methylmalonyl-CoA decarboxylase [Bacteroidetes bacterium]|nr:MAG: methylmalonyl-CoA decarboxylase [Bacteroidota bacterium]
MIKFIIDGQIAKLTFDNDKKRNSLNTVMLDEIIEALDRITNDIRVLIVTANKGTKVWSAGFNIEELPHPGLDPLPYDHPLEQVLRKMQEVECPVIAQIEGSVWGGAVDLVLRCDILIGTPKTSFAITPAKIGVPYNTSGIMRMLSSLNQNITKEMFFTARPVKAERAYQLGLLNHLVEVDELHDFVQEMAEHICSNSPLSIRVIKEQVNIISNSYPISINASEKIDQIRRVAYNSDDYVEGKKAFLEGRKPDFKGL